jgi:glycosyltransferase involved in cell wall biosynthesis
MRAGRSRGFCGAEPGILTHPIAAEQGSTVMRFPIQTAPVSVILPNYNHGRWLRRSLAALVSQVPAPLEIIVVDDGSTDDSVAIIESFRDRHASVRLLRHPVNRGAPAAVRTALAEARGEFLLFAAADDFVLPGLIARGVEALRAHPEAALFCSEVAVVDASGKLAGFRPATPPSRTSGYLSPADVRREIRRSDNWMVGPSVIYRRSHLEEIGYFDESLGTLGDGMATRLLAFRHGFCYEAEVLATWRVHPGSLSAQSSLSVSENQRLVETAGRWISEHFPADVRDSYRRLFERRKRFNMARLWVVLRDGTVNCEAISDLLQWGRLDRAVLRVLARIPLFTGVLVLGWMTLRRLPFSSGALITAFLQRKVVQRATHAAVERELAETPGPTSPGVGPADLAYPGAGPAGPAREVALRT